MSPSRNMHPLQQIKPWDLEVASATDFLEGCKSGPAYNGGGTCDDKTWPKSGGAVTTLKTEKPTASAAIANRAYATTRAPSPSTCLPRLLEGSPSSPMMTIESFPVPKDAPTAIRRQNSTVAQPKGIRPITKTEMLTSLLRGETAAADGWPTAPASARRRGLTGSPEVVERTPAS